MKKIIFSLLSAVALFAGADAWAVKPAEGQIELVLGGPLSYGQQSTDGRATVGTTFHIAQQVPADKVANLGGGVIESITMVSGSGPAIVSEGRFEDLVSRDYVAFFTHDLNGEPFYTMPIHVDGSYTEHTFKLPEPQVIDASKPLYFGYDIPILSKDDYYVALDANTAVGLYVAFDNGKYELAPKGYGNLVASFLLTGDKLPQNGVKVNSITANPAFDTENPNTFTLSVTNTGAALARNVTVDCTVNTATQQFKSDILDPETRQPKALLNGETGIVEVSGLTVATPSISQMILPRVTKVNDAANYTATQASTYVYAPAYPFSKGYKRVPVLEDITSTGCTWCPAGFAYCDYLNERYDTDFITIAYHVIYSSPRDLLSCDVSNAFDARYGNGYPYGVANRRTDIGFTRYKKLSEGVKQVNDVYDICQAVPSYGDLNLEATLDDAENPTQINVTVTGSFAFDVPQTNPYKISLLLLEDDLGPYKQGNAYSKNYEWDMGGWQELGSTVKTIMNHVVRDGDFPGVAGSVPDGLKAGETYTYTASMPMSTLKGDKFSIVALLTDDTNRGEIINARQHYFYEHRTGIESIAADTEVDAPAVWYTLQGVRVNNPSQPGIYVKVTGKKAEKVLVR